MLLDTTFDFRTDTPRWKDGRLKDPDACSPTLRQYHKLLWSKALPNGRVFTLDDTVRGHYLHHRSDLGEFSLASDSVIPSFTRWGFAAEHPELCTEEENEAFETIGYTIGGMMVFPGIRIDGKQTIMAPAGSTGRSLTGSTSRSNASADTTEASPARLVRRSGGTATSLLCSRASTVTWTSSCCRISSPTTAPT